MKTLFDKGFINHERKLCFKREAVEEFINKINEEIKEHIEDPYASYWLRVAIHKHAGEELVK